MEAESDAEAEALLGPEEKAEAIQKLPNFLPNLPNFLPQLFCLLLCLLFLPQLFLVPPTHVNKALIMRLSIKKAFSPAKGTIEKSLPENLPCKSLVIFKQVLVQVSR